MFRRFGFYVNALQSIILLAFGLEALQHKSFFDEFLISYWCVVAVVNFFYGSKNYLTARKKLRLVKKHSLSTIDYAQYVYGISFIRITVIPWLLSIGVFSIFAPKTTSPANPPLIQVIFGFVFVIALIWNETAFAIINRTEYLRDKQNRA